MTNCPNCQTPYVKAGSKTNLRLTQLATDFIHTFTNNTASAYCEACSKQALPIAKGNAQIRAKTLGAELTKHLHHVPLLSLPAPPDWKFEALGLVTGQSVTGTGVFAELASDWSDFFGTQSRAYNQKIAGGEKLCQMQLRLKCLEMGGNAVLGVDIDYAEVGAAKGMLMVCMTGTAVRLKNTEIVGVEKAAGLGTVIELASKQRVFSDFDVFISSASVAGITTSEGIS